MKTINQVKAVQKLSVRQMLHSINAEYNFLTPDSRKKLSIGVAMILREARRLADAEQTEIMVVLDDENII